MKRLRKREAQVTFHGWMGRIEAGGMKLGFVHAPDIAAAIARSEDFDMVFFGHTHLWKEERSGRTVLLNPGEIMGKKEPAGWALINTVTGEIEQVLVDSHESRTGFPQEKRTGGFPGTGFTSPEEQTRAGHVVSMMVHVRPDLYRAFMRCVWMLVHEEGLSPLEAQNILIEDFLRQNGC